MLVTQGAHSDQEYMSTFSQWKNQGRTEPLQCQNTSLTRSTLSKICTFQCCNGVLQSKTLPNLSIGKDVKGGGCGILELSIQQALTNLFNYFHFCAILHTQIASFSVIFKGDHSVAAVPKLKQIRAFIKNL